MPTARQRPIIPKDNGYIDRKTICFKHIRELAVKHSPRWSLALGLKIKPKRSNMFPLHDDRQHALRRQDPLPQADQAAPTRNFFIRTNKPISRRRLKRSTVWWSQTGSNRRPHACKARALPTELWPPLQGIGIQCSPDQAVSEKTRSGSNPKGWWAQADSNCRPHAYQACALTN